VTPSFPHIRELAFQLPQTVFSDLSWLPVHYHAADISVLIGDVPLEVGYLPICLEDVIAVMLGHDRKMHPDA